jgi:hypothetical protein
MPARGCDSNLCVPSPVQSIAKGGSFDNTPPIIHPRTKTLSPAKRTNDAAVSLIPRLLRHGRPCAILGRVWPIVIPPLN